MTPEAIRRSRTCNSKAVRDKRGGNASRGNWPPESPPRYSRARGWHFQSGRGSCQRGLQESDQDFERRTTSGGWESAGKTPAPCRRSGARWPDSRGIHSRRSPRYIGVTEYPSYQEQRPGPIRWRGRTTGGAPTRPIETMERLSPRIRILRTSTKVQSGGAEYSSLTDVPRPPRALMRGFFPLRYIVQNGATSEFYRIAL